jgi:uncharacterized membrane protein YphA (DoxX/SURF4 family)
LPLLWRRIAEDAASTIQSSAGPLCNSYSQRGNSGCHCASLCAADKFAQMSDANARRVLALVRIAVGVIFLFFAEYKIVGSEFVHGGFQKYVGNYVDQHQVVNWLRPTLTRYVLPHPYLWARVVAWSEALIGISLVLGLWVSLASLGGTIYMLALALCTWFAPGRGVPYWRYLGNNLDHIPLLMLFLIFLAFSAGTTWGMDGGRRFAPGRKRA